MSRDHILDLSTNSFIKREGLLDCFLRSFLDNIMEIMSIKGKEYAREFLSFSLIHFTDQTFVRNLEKYTDAVIKWRDFLVQKSQHKKIKKFEIFEQALRECDEFFHPEIYAIIRSNFDKFKSFPQQLHEIELEDDRFGINTAIYSLVNQTSEDFYEGKLINILFDMGNFESVIDKIDHLHEIPEKHKLSILEKKIISLIILGKKDSILIEAIKIKKISPDSPKTNFIMGFCLNQLKTSGSAISYLERSFEQQENNIETILEIIKAYINLGNRDKEEFYTRKFLDYLSSNFFTLQKPTEVILFGNRILYMTKRMIELDDHKSVSFLAESFFKICGIHNPFFDKIITEIFLFTVSKMNVNKDVFCFLSQKCFQYINAYILTTKDVDQEILSLYYRLMTVIGKSDLLIKDFELKESDYNAKSYHFTKIYYAAACLLHNKVEKAVRYLTETIRLCKFTDYEINITLSIVKRMQNHRLLKMIYDKYDLGEEKDSYGFLINLYKFLEERKDHELYELISKFEKENDIDDKARKIEGFGLAFFNAKSFILLKLSNYMDSARAASKVSEYNISSAISLFSNILNHILESKNSQEHYRGQWVFNEFIKDKCESAYLCFLFGKILYKGNNKDKALQYFKKSLDYSEPVLESYYYLAVIYLEKGDKENALRFGKLCAENLKRGVEYLEIFFNVLFLSSQYEEYLSAYSTISKEIQEHPVLKKFYILSLIYSGKIKENIDLIKSYILTSKDIENHLSDAINYLFNSNKIEEIQDLTQLILFSPEIVSYYERDDTGNFHEVFKCFFGDDFKFSSTDTSIEFPEVFKCLFGDDFKLSPTYISIKFPHLLSSIAKKSLKDRNVEKAMKYAKLSYKLNKNIDDSAEVITRCYFIKKDYVELMEFLEEQDRLKPSREEAFEDRILLNFNIFQDYEAVCNIFEENKDLLKHSSLSNYYYALCLLKKSSYEGYEYHIKIAYELDQKDSLINLEMCKISLIHNDILSARNFLFSINIEGFFESYSFYMMMGYISLKSYNYYDACNFFQKCLDANSKDVISHKLLSISSCFNGDIKNAIIEIKKAIQLSSNDPDLYCHLGCYLINLGSIKEAKSCFSKALTIDGDLKFAKDQIETINKILQELTEDRELDESGILSFDMDESLIDAKIIRSHERFSEIYFRTHSLLQHDSNLFFDQKISFTLGFDFHLFNNEVFFDI